MMGSGAVAAYIIGEDGLSTTVMADPQCGQDFCDDCGDCLSCYLDDPCYSNDGDEHNWVVYQDKLSKWREAHPEAMEESDD